MTNDNSQTQGIAGQDMKLSSINMSALHRQNSYVYKGQNHHLTLRTKNNSTYKVNISNVENSSFKEISSVISKKQASNRQEGHLLNQDQWDKLDELVKRIKFKSYIKKFLMLSQKRIYRLLNFSQFKLINDQTSYFRSKGIEDKRDQAQDQKTINTFLPFFIRKVIASFPIFKPNNPVLEFWQLLKIICVVVCFFFYLVSFTFNIPIQNLLQAQIYYGCQTCLILDIFVSLNTAIYLKGQLTTSRRQIFHQYKASKALFSDILQLFSFIIYIILYLSGYPLTRLVQTLLLPIILKHQDLNIIIKKMKNKFLLQKKAQNVFELINLMKNIFLISHVFACIWILTAKLSLDINFQFQLQEKSGNLSGQATWISLMNLESESWIIQYLYSFYFISVTMITVGYGDVRPTNPLEVGVCIFLMMTCCLIFGFTINSIGEIFQDIFSKEKNISQKRCIIGNYMQRKDINPSTQKQVFEYLEYYWREELDENIQETEKILNQLSNNLKQELQLESNKLILSKNKILRDHFSYEVLTNCLPFILEQNCTPGEIIIDQKIGNVENYLYFIQQGDLEVYVNCPKYMNSSRGQQTDINPIKKLKKGDNFGQTSFFTGERESQSVRSINFSTLLKIKRSDFIQIIKQYQIEYERFCMIKDKIIYSGFHSQLYESCSACHDRTHTEIRCPILHYVPKKFKIIQQNSKSSPHYDRSTFHRKVIYKRSTLFSLENNLNKYFQFSEDQFQQLDDYENENLQYSLFKQNISLNDLDELNQLEKQQQYLHAHFTKKDQTIEIGRKFLNNQKLSSQLNIMQVPHQSKTIEEESQELSQKNLINSQLIDNELENESVSQKKQTFIKRDQKSRHKQLSINQQNSINHNYQNIIEQDDSQEMESTVHQEKQNNTNQGNHRKSFLSNLSSKDINVTELLAKIQKQQEYISQMKNKNLFDNQMFTNLLSSIKIVPLQVSSNKEFDIFQGQFDTLFNFKNYFPLQNCKEIIQKLNENNSHKKKGRATNLSFSSNKKENSHSSQGRRNNKRNSINQSHKPLYPTDSFLSIQIKKNEFIVNSPQIISTQNQKMIPFIDDLKVNINNSVLIKKDTKFETETPRTNEEQVHLRGQPSVCQPKRSYLSNKINSITCDFSMCDNTQTNNKNISFLESGNSIQSQQFE